MLQHGSDRQKKKERRKKSETPLQFPQQHHSRNRKGAGEQLYQEINLRLHTAAQFV